MTKRNRRKHMSYREANCIPIRAIKTILVDFKTKCSSAQTGGFGVMQKCLEYESTIEHIKG